MDIKSFPRYASEPRLLHGGDYNPDQWLNYPQILADDVKYMQEVCGNAFSVGIFAWATLEPTEGNFEFGWLDKIIENIHSIGGKVVLATPSGARPAWLSHKYPEVLRTNNYNQKMQHGHRHNHCFSSPMYREKTGIINRKLAERYKDHPAIIMWHVSNEYGGECFCNYCRENFRNWLREKYKTLDALNHAFWNAFWSHTYTCFSQIEPPSPIGENGVHALTLDWQRFVTHQTIDFYRHEIAPLREVTPDIPVTTNFMADMISPHPYDGLDYAKFAREVDIITWDAYPAWHNDYETTEFLASKLAFMNDYFRTLKDQPFLILECTPSAVNWHPINRAKRPGMHKLSSLAKLAHGSDAIMYFQWRKSRGSSEKFHGAVVDHDNSTANRVFRDVAEVGEMLEKLQEIKDTKTPAKIAILFDTENQWALNSIAGFDNRSRKYSQTVHAHYKAFWDMNISVDVVTRENDLTKYAMVVAPMIYMCGDALANKFKDYVAGGGRLVSTYLSGMVDETDLVHEGCFHPTLREIFGMTVSETDALYPQHKNSIRCFTSNTYEAMDYCSILDCTTAEMIGIYGRDFYSGTPAVTYNEYGAGYAYFIGTRTGEDFLGAFYRMALIDNTKIPIAAPPPIITEPGVSVATRVSDNASYYFVMNFNEYECDITLERDMYDILTDTHMPCGGYPISEYGVFVLKV